MSRLLDHSNKNPSECCLDFMNGIENGSKGRPVTPDINIVRYFGKCVIAIARASTAGGQLLVTADSEESRFGSCDRCEPCAGGVQERRIDDAGLCLEGPASMSQHG